MATARQSSVALRAAAERPLAHGLYARPWPGEFRRVLDQDSSELVVRQMGWGLFGRCCRVQFCAPDASAERLLHLLSPEPVEQGVRRIALAKALHALGVADGVGDGRQVLEMFLGLVCRSEQKENQARRL